MNNRVYDAMVDIGDVLNALQYFEEPTIREFYLRAGGKEKMLVLSANFFGIRYDGLSEEEMLDEIVKELKAPPTEWERTNVFERSDGKAILEMLAFGRRSFKVIWTLEAQPTRSEEFASEDEANAFVDALSASREWQFLKD